MKQQSRQQPHQPSGNMQGTVPVSRAANLFILSALLLFGICVCILIAVIATKEFNRIQQNEQQEKVDLMGGIIETYVDNRLDIINGQTEFPSIKQAVMHPEDHKADINDFMSTLSILGTKPQMILLDFEGAQIHATQETPDVDFTGYPWVSQIIDGMRSQYAGILQLPGGPHWCIAVPVLYNGQPEGILTTVIPLGDILNSVHLIHLLDKADLVIVQKGIVVARFGDDNASGSTQKTVLGRFNLTLYYTGQAAQISAARNRILFTVIGLLVLMSLLITLVTVTLARKWFVKPLQQLREATHIISSKTSATLFMENRSRIQEIVLLTDDLTVMAQQVDDRESKLEKLVEAVKNSEERLESAMDAGKHGSWEWNIGTGETYFDERYYAMAGYEYNEFPQNFESWNERVHPEDLPGVEASLKSNLSGESDSFDAEFRWKQRDGTWMWIQGKGKIIKWDASGAPVLMVGTHTDITGQKQTKLELNKTNKLLEEETAKAKDLAVQAQSANRAKSEFLAGMSHEIRTPMNAVLGFTQVLERDPSLTPRQLEYVTAISRGGNHLLGLINDILDISKIEAGKIELLPGVFSLHDMLGDLEMMFRSRAEARHLQLTVDRDDGLPSHVLSDEDKVRKVLINLLGNAVKFTEQGGVALRVRGEPVRERSKGKDKSLHLIFEVEDSGPGISQSDLEKVFDKFSQTEVGAKAGGTGLGLAISRQLAEIMGGGINCESEQGKGSCFCFDLLCEPVHGDQKDPRESRRVKGLATGTTPGRILVVDDNAVNRDLLHALLLPLGFEIRNAENGKEAVEIFEAWSPSAVLMDISMPVMDGYEATRRIKATRAGRDVPVIVLTAHAFKEQEEKIMATGASIYIRKPFKEEEIYEALGKCLGISFVYEEKSAVVQKHPQTSDIAAEDLTALPRELVQTMLEALTEGDITRLLELIGQVQPLDEDAARGLKAMADRYDYQTLEKLLSNGGNNNE